ncbi:MAG: 4Fe-4S dicluster domain-containing protein [Candidatus Eisenbacteria bacterium]|jgi:NAD-dependent dihydropyrimidine dehydrogenase PreA subunit|nr:4Fe-4S dicluster domain-containing protein [Candidatus Eisenbacteria bacterium]
MPTEAPAVSEVIIREEECKGCHRCVDACPAKVLEVATHFNLMSYHPARYRGEGCTGCATCFYTCPEPGAITVIRRRG